MRNVLTLLAATVLSGAASAQVPCPSCGTVPNGVVQRRVVTATPRTVWVTPAYPVRQNTYVVPGRPGRGFFNRPDTSGGYVPPPPIPMIHIPEPVIPHPQ